MADQDNVTAKQPLWPIFKRTAASFFWKLMIVAAGVSAYHALNSLEQAKSDFDKAKSPSLVIVDDPRNVEQRGIIELSATQVTAFFDGYENEKIADKKQFVVDMGRYVNRVKYQPVQEIDELLNRMNQEILKDEATENHTSEQQRDLLQKQFAARKASFIEKCALPEATPPSPAVEKITSNKKAPPVKPCAQSLKKNATCAQITDQFSCWETNYNKELAALTRKDSEVNQKREAQVKAVYEHLRPKLNNQVQKVERAKKIDSFAFLFSGEVLDDRNGIHVIFKIFWLTCMVILVFGVLFVILLLLRPLPPFAAGTEALSEQAKSFLSRRSATPELARTAMVTITALGIGTAVAVAGGMNMPSGDRKTNLETAEWRYDIKGPGHEGTTSNTPIINVTAAPVSPPPITIEVPPENRMTIDELLKTYAKLDTNVQTLTQELTTLKSGVDQTLDRIDSVMDQKVQPVGARLTSVSDELAFTKSELATLKAEATTLKTEFLTRIDGLNTSLHDLKNEDLNQVRIPAHRNFFSKTASLFSLNNERYLVTTQSYLALRRLMCVKNVFDRPTNPCTVDATCNCENNKLVETLRTMIGGQPMTETRLSQALSSVDAANWKAWKSIILRYTRVI